ncbi:MAG: DUF1015 family protein [Bacteroidota bacterium]|nr:DUF1015 family protein [Bacteroidota bacterium]
MASIKPFRALRPVPEHARSFSANAFDADSAVAGNDLKAQKKLSQFSYLNILNPESSDLKYDSEEAYFQAAKEQLNSALLSGALLDDAQSSVYIYRQAHVGNVFTGIIALASTAEYRQGKIKRHELTRTDKQQKIAGFFQKVGINGSPVLLTYPGEAAIKLWLTNSVEKAPDYHFISSRDTEHSLWVVSDEDELENLRTAFLEIPALYIADGHHRTASYELIEEIVPHFMACFMAEEEVKIFPFHRYLESLNGIRSSDFFEKLAEVVKVTPLAEAALPAFPGIVHIYMEKKWHKIEFPGKFKNQPNPKDNLDVSILESEIIEKILGFRNIHSGQQITYAGGHLDAAELIKPVDEGKMQVLFLLYPISSREVRQISDAGETLPPKSTWIEPKMRSGLLIQKF